ncbi:MAG TPA: protein kinase [Polyangiaceae bacterium]
MPEGDDKASNQLQPGTIVADKYRILRRIGSGGMAEVYAAHHEILHQTVAIKVLLPEVANEPIAASRFLNEARAAARIRGENIVGVMDVGMLPGGAAFMVLEYLEGHDLEAHAAERGPLPVVEAVDHVLGALQAIAQAHAMGIVHRDLKPSNLFLAQQPDGSSVVKVLDFGISKATNRVDGQSTSTQAILGSPFYMAPEQARSAKSVDARADIWALGVILYRLLGARLPFVGETLTELLLAIVQDQPVPLRQLRPDVPEQLEAIVARCLRKDRNERFADVGELAVALRPFGGPDSTRAVGRVTRTLSSSSGTGAAPYAATARAGSEAGPNTNPSWAQGSKAGPAQAANRGRRMLWAGGALVLVVLASGAFVSLRGRPSQGVPAAAGVAPAVSTVPVASVTASAPPPIASSSAPLVAPDSASAIVSAPTQPAPAPRPAVGPRPAPSAKPAPSATPSASTTYDVLNQRN